MLNDAIDLVFPYLTEVDPPPTLEDAGPKDRLILLTAYLEEQRDFAYAVDLVCDQPTMLQDMVFTALRYDLNQVDELHQFQRFAEFVKNAAKFEWEDDINEAITERYGERLDD